MEWMVYAAEPRAGKVTDSHLDVGNSFKHKDTTMSHL